RQNGTVFTGTLTISSDSKKVFMVDAISRTNDDVDTIEQSEQAFCIILSTPAKYHEMATCCLNQTMVISVKCCPTPYAEDRSACKMMPTGFQAVDGEVGMIPG